MCTYINIEQLFLYVFRVITNVMRKQQFKIRSRLCMLRVTDLYFVTTLSHLHVCAVIRLFITSLLHCLFRL